MLETDDRVDYSDRADWWDCIKGFAIAQQDYPLGIGVNGSGVNQTIDIKKSIVGHKPMWEIPPRDLRRVMSKLRTTYQRMKKRHRNGKV